MKKSFINICLIACFGLGITSCENRLDIAKHGNMGSQESFYKTDEEADEALASVYLSFRSLHYNWYLVKNLLSDDSWCGGGSRGDNSDLEKLNEYNFGTDHGSIQGLYSGLYGLIYKACLVTDQVEPNTTEKKRCVAEAKFFRAFAHFELAS